jgi:hypothetical protein
MKNVFTRPSFATTLEKYWGASSNRCGLLNCSGTKSLWRRVWARRHGVRFEGVLYCHPQCLETAFRQELLRVQNQATVPPPANRMPLGLLMVARGRLTYDQVSAALAAQKKTGTGNIGEWFEKLGFLTEQEVTGALALQWGCPVASSLEFAATSHKLPRGMLESFLMWPLHYVSATNTQYVAFGKRVDHAVLYAMEKMLGCRVQPCVAAGTAIAKLIERLRQEPRSGEVEFRSIGDPAEILRVATSYIARLDAEEVRMSRVGEFIWLLLKNRGTTINVTFRLQHETPPAEEAAEPDAAGIADFTPTSRRDLWQNGAFSAVSWPVS